MAKVIWSKPGTSGFWSSGPWTGLAAGETYPGQVTSSDAVTLGGGLSSYTVTDNVVSLSVASLTFTSPLLGLLGAKTSLLMSTGESLTVGGNVSLVAGTTIEGAGALSVGGTISGRGTIMAGTPSTGGTLALTGAGSLSTGSPPVLAIGTAAPSTLKLAFTGNVTASPITIDNVNQTLEIAGVNVTINGAQNVTNGTLQMAGGTLADTSGISLGTRAASGTLTGFGTVTGNLSRSGSGTANIVQAVGGQLDLKGSIGSGLILAIDSSALARLKIDGTATASTPISLSSANQTLEVGPTGWLTISAVESITGGTIQIDGGKLTDDAGLAVGAGATVIGSGTLTAPFSGTGSIVASGGTLHLTGTVASGPSLAIANAAGSTLSIENTATAAAPIAIANATQTLAIGASGKLTVNGGAESITNGTIVLTGGTLLDDAGVAIGAGAELSGVGTAGNITLAGGTIAQSGGALNLASIVGFGVMSGSPTVSGSVTASGGLLDLTGNLASTTTAYQIGSAAGSVLEVAGTAAAGTTFAFGSSNGTLKLADVANGIVQQFNGTIAGLGGGNAINIQAAVTSATLMGNTITVLNGTTTVAVLKMSTAPPAGLAATVAADNKLGGFDVSLDGSVISTSVVGPIVLFTYQNPLIITNTGAVTSTGAGADGIDAPSGTAWTISNNGGVISSAGTGIFLNGRAAVTNDGLVSGVTGVLLGAGGYINNNASGSISASGTIGGGWQVGAGVAVTGVAANVSNAGSISGAAYGISMAQGGSITNTASIIGGEDGVVAGGAGTDVVNSGQIIATVDDGIGLFAGGSVSNAQDALIEGAGSAGAGIFITGGLGTVSNGGSISTSGTRFGILLTGGGTLSNTAGGSVSGGVAAILINNAVGTISNAGTLTATGAAAADLESGGRVDNLAGGVISAAEHGVFVASNSTGTVTNAGVIRSTEYSAVSIAAGSVTNSAGGSIIGGTNGVFVGGGIVENAGSINAEASGGAGVYLGDGGTAINDGGGIVTGSAFGVFAFGAAATVTNSGIIESAHGVALEAGGTVTNGSGGSIVGQVAGILAQGAATSIDNFGDISAAATGGAGAELDAGGSVTNESGATLSGTAYGVFIGGGTVTNAGTIGGSSYAVKFTGTNTVNRLIVQPGAVFNGAVGGADSTANTLEFASGTAGTLSGVSGGSGSVAPTSGSAWSFFHNFDTIAVDAGASWTFSGSDTLPNLTNDGTVGVSGALVVSSIDPSSTGIFDLSGATFEVASALGSGGQMAFLANSALIVDDAASFGMNVGTSTYAGPSLQDFTSGDSIDLKNFASAGATFSYDDTTGLLQMVNGSSQQATLLFATASLGSSSFQLASDGGAGILVQHS